MTKIHSLPPFRSCTSCGRSDWKIGLVYATVEEDRGAKTKCLGFCPGCFADHLQAAETGKGYGAGYVTTAIGAIDRRGERTKKQHPLPTLPWVAPEVEENAPESGVVHTDGAYAVEAVSGLFGTTSYKVFKNGGYVGGTISLDYAKQVIEENKSLSTRSHS